MAIHDIDFTKVMCRNYRSQFRFVIDCPSTITNKAHYYRHYMARWSTFISRVMRNKLTKTQVRDLLPDVRDTLPIKTKLADIYPLLQEADPSLARLILDCSAVFEAAPHELKSHILVAFGLDAQRIQAYLDHQKNQKKDVA